MENGLVCRKPMAFPGPGEGVSYSLEIRLDPELEERVRQARRSIAEPFHSSFQDPVPVIPIAGFRAHESMEETLIRWMHRALTPGGRFFLTLNNYGGLPEHCIYIRVMEQEALRVWRSRFAAIDGYIRANECPPVSFSHRLLLPVMEGLKPDAYGKLLPFFSRELFHEKFEVRECCLFRQESLITDPRLVARFGLATGNGILYHHKKEGI